MILLPDLRTVPFSFAFFINISPMAGAPKPSCIHCLCAILHPADNDYGSKSLPQPMHICFTHCGTRSDSGQIHVKCLFALLLNYLVSLRENKWENPVISLGYLSSALFWLHYIWSGLWLGLAKILVLEWYVKMRSQYVRDKIRHPFSFFFYGNRTAAAPI